MAADKNETSKKILKWLVSISFALAWPAHSETITFVGKLKAELPTVSISESDNPVSDVKKFTLSVSPNGGVCSIAANQEDAKKHGSTPICLITWEDPKGLDAYVRGLQGAVKGAGAHTFKYKLSMFDKDKFDLLSQHEYSVTFESPVAPDQPSLRSFWKLKPESADLTHNIYNKKEVNTSFVFDITPRNYNQKIEIGGYECVIPEKSTTCTIQVDEQFINQVGQGERTLPFRSADTFGHFQKEMTDFKYIWDFRPAEIVAVHVNSDESRLPKVINDYGETLVLMHNQAAVVVKSPHAELNEDWWLPTDPTLIIKPNKELNVTKTLRINNLQVNFDLGTTTPDSYVASPIAKPAVIGGNLVYVYDFTEINDGLYDFIFSTQDKNENGEQQTLEEIYVDRETPDIQFVVNGRQQRTNSPISIYSISDITVAAWGGWEDGSKITSAKINDEEVGFAGGTDLIKRLADIDLPLGSLNTLEITAQDKTGNEVTKHLDFNFGKYEFKDYSSTAMAGVQKAEIFLEHVEGASCIAATSDELARLYSETSSSLRRGCTIEWTQLPAGIDAAVLKSLTTKKIKIGEGIINTPGSHEYAFKVHQYDAFGFARVVYEGSGALEITPLQAPGLTVGIAHIADNFSPDYKYKLPQDRSLSIPASVSHTKNADVVAELRDSVGNIVETREFRSRRQNTRFTFLQKNEFDPLSTGNYSVRTYYKVNPDVFTEKPYHFFTTPPRSVRLTLQHPEIAVSGTDIPVIAQIGINSLNGFTYSANLGEWSIYLAKYDKVNNEYVTISPIVNTDVEGKVNLTLSTEALVESDNRVVAFAKLNTPFPEVDFGLSANSLFKVPVLTSGSISVQLTADDTSAPVPANFLVSVGFQTDTDKLSAKDISWEESIDGLVWKPVSRADNQQASFFSMTEVGNKFVRATITHKLTSVTTKTNVIKLNAYAEAILKLTGDSRVMAGAVGQFEFELNEYASQNLTGDVEWSSDGGTTWQAMNPTDETVIDSTIEIIARALISPENVAPFYIEDKLTVTHVDPQSMRAVVMLSDKHAEIGDEITMTARLSKSDAFSAPLQRYHYELPNGHKVADLSLNHILEATDFSDLEAKFIFRTWIEGYELQTMTSQHLNVKQLIYSFPETDVKVMTPERLIQSNINIQLDKPKPYLLPKRVILTEEFILPPELTVHRHIGNHAILVASAPGVHSFTVRFYDNRGNQKEHIRFVDTFNPEAMKIFMTNRLEGKHIRPPIRLISRLIAKPGSPRDKTASIKWFLNDELISDDVLNIHRAVIEAPGDYTLRAEVESEFGQTAQSEYKFLVKPNKAPHCEPFWETRDRTLTINPNCMDDDGKVVRIDVTFNIDDEQEKTITRYTVHQISFIKDRYPSNKPLRILVIDDSGEEINLNVAWPN